MNMTKEELLNMSLHEVVELNRFVSVMKVLGGWVYLFSASNGVATEFVSSRGKE
jgi:hypothetical protein